MYTLISQNLKHKELWAIIFIVFAHTYTSICTFINTIPWTLCCHILLQTHLHTYQQYARHVNACTMGFLRVQLTCIS